MAGKVSTPIAKRTSDSTRCIVRSDGKCRPQQECTVRLTTGYLVLLISGVMGKANIEKKIDGPIYENCYLRINTYRELDNKFESPDNVLIIKARRLEYLWHVVGLTLQGQ